MDHKHSRFVEKSGTPCYIQQSDEFDSSFRLATYADLVPYTENGMTTIAFIDHIVELIEKHVVDSSTLRSSKVIEFATPTELEKLIDFKLVNNSITLGEISALVESILKHSLKSGHPRYFNALWAGIDITCLMGEWITAATSTSMATFEFAPVYLCMEKHVLKTMNEFVGFSDGDGFLFPGGSAANIEAMSLARFKICPDVKQEGLFGRKRLTSYVSEEGHYSILKAAAMLGLGEKNVVMVKTDSEGRMIPSDLELRIIEDLDNGLQPFFVCATSGTTVAGAFDPLDDVADVCEKYNVWMHVDGSWGGSAIISKRHRGLLKGSHRANSFSWDPHKLMNCLLQCSVLLVREQGLLYACNRSGAAYLFPKDKLLYDVALDTGDKTFQCSRRVDILKLWLMWKAKGTSGIEEQIDKAFENSRYLASEIKKRKNFVLIREPQCTNVCFRYIPPRLAALPDGPEKDEQMARVPPEIKRRMTIDGTMLVSYQPLKQHYNFFRVVVINPGVEPSDMDFVLNEIERLGSDL